MKRIPVTLVWVDRLIPDWAIGQAWPNRVLLKRNTLPRLWRALCAHELCHILQWDRLGVWRMAWQYAYEWKRYGYYAMPLEAEARAAELDPGFLRWADEVLAQGGP